MQQQPYPKNAVEAVTHPNPYPYYAELVAQQPIHFDESLGCWVASSAHAVTECLTREFCRVRPPGDPVPNHLIGLPSGELFGRLIRMNDGTHHDVLKQAVSITFDAINPGAAAQHARHWAQSLFAEMQLQTHQERLSDFAFHLPICTVARLLDVPENQLPQIADWVSAYVACLAPTATQTQIDRGSAAVCQLSAVFDTLLESQNESGAELLSTFLRCAGACESDRLTANVVGFLSQTYEAAAGLIGNTLVALAARDELYTHVRDDLSLLKHVIAEVLRYDPPVQNTRRYVAQNGIVAGENMREGDTILVVLAAANRDPLANREPGQFQIFRENRQVFTFGLGAHACPGRNLAVVIATAALEEMIAADVTFDLFSQPVKYRPSVNARIPLSGQSRTA